MAFKIFKPKKYHLGMTGDEVKAALEGGGGGSGVPVKIIHINLREDTIEEDYDTILSYFTDYENGKCVIMVGVGEDGFTPLVMNWTGPGGFWIEINPDTGLMIITSFIFIIDTEEETVTLSHYTVTFTGTLG